jgi:hypothetical protein
VRGEFGPLPSGLVNPLRLLKGGQKSLSRLRRPICAGFVSTSSAILPALEVVLRYEGLRELQQVSILMRIDRLNSNKTICDRCKEGAPTSADESRERLSSPFRHQTLSVERMCHRQLFFTKVINPKKFHAGQTHSFLRPTLSRSHPP